METLLKCPENERYRLSDFNNPEASVSVSLCKANSGFAIRLTVNETTYLVRVHTGGKLPDGGKNMDQIKICLFLDFFIASKTAICLKLI